MLARVKLHLSEEEFWSMTPRKFSALLNAFFEYEIQTKSPRGSSVDDKVSKPNKGKEVVDTTIDAMPSWWG